jgi:hypothetical protein
VQGSGPMTYTLTTGEEIIDLSLKNLGPADLTLVTAWIQRPEVFAVVTDVALSSNPIGYPVSASLNGAVIAVPVKKGVFAAVDRRWGEVAEDPDPDDEVQLRWLDDGEESSYFKTNKLSPVIASRADLIEDYSHIEKLGQAVTQLTKLTLADCSFNQFSTATFARSVNWADVALAKIDISFATINEEALAALKAVAPEGCEILWKPEGQKDNMEGWLLKKGGFRKNWNRR